MQVIGSVKRETPRGFRVNGAASQSSRLSLYSSPPPSELSLDEFEMSSLDRLEVLRTIEYLKSRGVKGDEYKQKLADIERRNIPLRSREFAEEDERKDLVSHFILRLAFCRTEDLRRWFLTQECALLRYRLETTLGSTDQQQFMRSNGLDYELVDISKDYDLQRSVTTAQMSVPGYNTASAATQGTRYYKVPFQDALELVAMRAVLLRGGYAYVPTDRLVSIIVARFRAQLSRALASAFKALPAISSDHRIAPLLHSISTHSITADFGAVGAANKGAVTPDMVEALSKRSFPLCMSEMHRTLRTTHKLKYAGRTQYRLFLKGIGLTLDDCIAFFQAEFTKVMTADAFNKQYLYNIKHSYGKVGKRTDHHPAGCSSLLKSMPGAGECHGCPYQSYDTSHLTALLRRMGLSSQAVDEITTTAGGREPQMACRKHFEAAHSGVESALIETVGNHPNAWYEASVRHYGGHEKSRGETGGVKTEQQAAAAGGGGGSATAAASGGSSGAQAGAPLPAASPSSSSSSGVAAACTSGANSPAAAAATSGGGGGGTKGTTPSSSSSLKRKSAEQQQEVDENNTAAGNNGS